MDTQRLILFFVFSFSLLLLWDSWQKENRPPATAPAQGSQGRKAQTAVPSPSVSTQATPTPQQKLGDSIPPTGSAPAKSDMVKVKTDTIVADVDLQGGDIVRLELLKQRDTLDEKANFVLFTPEHHYAAQSGLIGPGLPTHKFVYRSSAR